MLHARTVQHACAGGALGHTCCCRGGEVLPATVTRLHTRVACARHTCPVNTLFSNTVNVLGWAMQKVGVFVFKCKSPRREPPKFPFLIGI